jgi:hypothetical protein
MCEQPQRRHHGHNGNRHVKTDVSCYNTRAIDISFAPERSSRTKAYCSKTRNAHVTVMTAIATRCPKLEATTTELINLFFYPELSSRSTAVPKHTHTLTEICLQEMNTCRWLDFLEPIDSEPDCSNHALLNKLSWQRRHRSVTRVSRQKKQHETTRKYSIPQFLFHGSCCT